ncbi:MAG: hypothetical protein IPK97_21240 [Ahniella sp.]|nr:hypothetical protein [Ahniella sp.]
MLDVTSLCHADPKRQGSPRRISFALCFVAVLFAGAALEASARPATSSERTRALDNYGKLAIGFIKNQGQAPSDIAFYLQSPGKSLYFTDRGHALRLVNGSGADARTHTVRVELVGAESAPMRGAQQAEGLVSYFRGAKDEWHTGIPVYQEILYVQPWPGVALSYQSEGGSLNRSTRSHRLPTPGRSD